jgi:hypothetical protein
MCPFRITALRATPQLSSKNALSAQHRQHRQQQHHHRALTTRVRCVSIFLDKNRRYIGKSQSKWPPKRTQRTPHLLGPFSCALATLPPPRARCALRVLRRGRGRIQGRTPAGRLRHDAILPAEPSAHIAATRCPTDLPPPSLPTARQPAQISRLHHHHTRPHTAQHRAQQPCHGSHLPSAVDVDEQLRAALAQRLQPEHTNGRRRARVCQSGERVWVVCHSSIRIVTSLLAGA